MRFRVVRLPASRHQTHRSVCAGPSVRCWLLAALASCTLATTDLRAGVNYEEAPIHYSQTLPVNRVSRIQQRLAAGEIELPFTEPHGYLPALLKSLEVPESSQVLVFSKTSLQKHHVSPSTPRAIYFNDEVHVGYVQHGVLELAVTDPQLGMVFYTLEQHANRKPTFERQTNTCLTCHSSGRTRNVPGLQVRSVFPDPEGQPVVAAGSFHSTHASPLAQRWGGWYVTGTHGAQTHLGNFILSEKKKPKTIENAGGQNRAALTDRLDLGPYLTPHSDLVALMVLEHQADALNAFTAAGYAVRLAEHELATGKLRRKEELSEQINAAANDVARVLLFQNEARLTHPLRGTSTFADDFTAAGRRDAQQRSLREFDLQSRMFKYPCSYLIDSPGFQSLPQPLRSAVYRRLQAVLAAEMAPDGFPQHSTADRLRLRELLPALLPELAAVWNTPMETASPVSSSDRCSRLEDPPLEQNR